MTYQTLLDKKPAQQGGKVLDLKDLPPFVLKNTQNPVSEVAVFLERVAARHILPQRRCVILPSVMTLAHFFNVAPEEVLAALRELKNRGLDHAAGGLYGHVSLYDRQGRTRRKIGASSNRWHWLSWPQDILKQQYLNVS